jgi:hypothetical protein
MNPTKLVFAVILSAVSIGNAQNVLLSPTTTQTVTQPSGTTLDVNVLNNESVVGLGSFTTIGSAITAAGNNGSVLIPPSYAGTDTFNSNQYGVHMEDDRPLCLTYGGTPPKCTSVNSHTPVRYVYAADYGALCKGIASGIDDTAAINAALNTPYAYTQANGAYTNTVVVLPQGSCVISAPLNLGWHGSLVGQGSDSTYIVANYASWVGSTYNAISIVVSGAQAGGASQGQRRISDFSLTGIYGTTIPNYTTGIFVNNTSNQPAPSQYAVPNISFDHLLIAQFDTCFQAQDMINSQFSFDHIQNCRLGLYFNGDVQNNFIDHTTIGSGTLAYSGTGVGGATEGFILTPNSKYPPGPDVDPQGIFFHDSSILDWNIDLDIEQCLSCDFHDNDFDLGASGSGAGETILIGVNGVGGNGLWIHHNLIGVVDPNAGQGIYSLANTNGTTTNGLWITDNVFLLDNSQTPVAVYGAVFAGSANMFAAHITGNQFIALTEGIVLEQRLINSYIRDNNFSQMGTQAINLSGIANLAHTNSVIDGNIDNYDAIPVIYEGTATGYQIGYNASEKQWTGTQTVSAAGCAITAGAVGNVCGSPVTLTWANAFADTAYTIQCSIQSPAYPTGVATQGILNGASIQVNEVALSASSTGGGQINCTGKHE